MHVCGHTWTVSYTCMRRPQVDVQYSFPLLFQLSYWHRVSLSNSERASLSGQLVCGSSVLFKAEITGRLPPCSLYLTWIPGSKFWSCKHFKPPSHLPRQNHYTYKKSINNRSSNNTEFMLLALKDNREFSSVWIRGLKLYLFQLTKKGALYLVLGS